MGKRSILAAGILGLVCGGVWLTWWVTQGMPAQEPAQTFLLPDEGARTAFLEAQGVEESRCIAAEDVRLPVQADDAYTAYAALQEAQALPLAAHLGEPARRYTYTQNSSGQASLRTELLVSESGLLLGAMQYEPANPVPRPLLTES